PNAHGLVAPFSTDGKTLPVRRKRQGLYAHAALGIVGHDELLTRLLTTQVPKTQDRPEADGGKFAAVRGVGQRERPDRMPGEGDGFLGFAVVEVPQAQV